MVTSDNGRSVHDDTQEYEDAEAVDDVGLDSGGFVSNPKQVSGTDAVSVDRSGMDLEKEITVTETLALSVLKTTCSKSFRQLWILLLKNWRTTRER